MRPKYISQWQYVQKYRNFTKLSFSPDHLAWLLGGWLQSGSAVPWKLEVSVSFDLFSQLE
jgi:hypothetical protein